MSASIKDNILFSHEYDEDFYRMVLDGAMSNLTCWSMVLNNRNQQHVRCSPTWLSCLREISPKLVREVR